MSRVVVLTLKQRSKPSNFSESRIPRHALRGAHATVVRMNVWTDPWCPPLVLVPVHRGTPGGEHPAIHRFSKLLKLLQAPKLPPIALILGSWLPWTSFPPSSVGHSLMFSEFVPRCGAPARGRSVENLDGRGTRIVIAPFERGWTLSFLPPHPSAGPHQSRHDSRLTHAPLRLNLSNSTAGALRVFAPPTMLPL